jgi:PAS domain S-box-containing protein
MAPMNMLAMHVPEPVVWLLPAAGVALGWAGGFLWSKRRSHKELQFAKQTLQQSWEEAQKTLTELTETETKFRLLFERSADAIFILEPRVPMFIDCNQAAVEMMGAEGKKQVLSLHPAAMSTELQPDGRSSVEKTTEMIELAIKHGSHRFEWVCKRFNGEELPIEVVLTPIQLGNQPLMATVCRDIKVRKKAEARIHQLNQELEARVNARTAELSSANARLTTEIAERRKAEALLKESEEQARILVDNAPEAIVVLDVDTGFFINANENACRLLGYKKEDLMKLGIASVSPLVQVDGRFSSEAGYEKVTEALEGKAPVFEWIHKNADGNLIPCEVRLVRLPAEGRKLVRGSIIDNTERRRKEKIQKAIYQISEAIHTAGDLDSLYKQIHTTVKELMPADNFFLALHDPASDMHHFVYHVDEVDQRPPPRKLKYGMSAYVLQTGKPLLADRTAMLQRQLKGTPPPLPAGENGWYVESGTPSAIWLGVPLVVNGKALGVMVVQDYHDEKAYGEEEKRILAFMAEQTALAIERKQAQQALRLRSEQILRHRNVLLELAKLDKSDFDLALEKICSLAAAAFKVARVSYWSLQDNSSAIVCEALYLHSRKSVDASFKGTRLDKKACPDYFKALEAKEAIVANHVLTHPATSALADGYLKPLGISSMLDAPVWVHGRVVGVLCHEHVGLAREWTAEEIDFASSVATMVSLAIEAAQRARSEQSLRESEEKHRALFESASHGVLLHDEKAIFEVNSAALRMFGFENEAELLGKAPWDISAPVQQGGETSESLARKNIQTALNKGSARFEWVARRKDGKDFPVEVLITPIPLHGRTVIQAVINDITERKQAETELLKALAREKELGVLKSNFVALVSHEFRTPLGIIMSSAEILDSYLDQLDAAYRKEHLQSIAKNAKRMANLMEEVLLFGQAEAGKMELHPADMSLTSFCRRLKDEVLSATDRQCPIILTMGELPAEIFADERALRHIFTNLLVNAVKYSKPGSPVHFTVGRDGRDAVFQVRDQGIGIPEADQQWLFKAFHRGSNAAYLPGTGLGLVIVKRSVELHNGKIQVESVVDQGTQFTVTLPLFEVENEKNTRH